MKPTAATSATCRAAILLALAFPAWSQSSVEPAPAPATAAVPTGKLVANYSDFAGSPDNASSLVNGLRTGTPVTLTDPAVPGGPPPVPTTFTPPTRPMGYGNIRIALSLAKAQLASQGITNPTAGQLQGAMMGTTAPDGTTTQGILQMRADGMGWGKIANTMGFKLGAVMSGKQTYAAAATGTSTTAATHGRSSVTTAAGTSVSTAGKSKGVVTGAGNAGGQGHSKGIVTAAGASGGGAGVTTGLGHGHASAGGTVNAAGGKAGSHAGGNGKGGGKP